MALFKSDVSNSLKKEFLKSVSIGLNRQHITTCSRWAEKYRIMSSDLYVGQWDFKYYPWLKDMHDSEAELNIGQKAAQVGYTETLLNICFYHIDIKAKDVLYVLPSRTPDASDFSASRFDAALELSPHLEDLFSDVKNIGHKRAGAANLYIRGSKSRSGLKSIPVGLLILDELNEMPERNIPLALERTSGQLHKRKWMVSTPTLDDFGISKYFNNSTQNHFYFKCPSCSRYIELSYPESLKIYGTHITDPDIKKSHLICSMCDATLHHQDKINFLNNKSKWIQSYSDRDDVGWYISQLYSLKVSPSDLAIAYFAAQQNPADEQEFYNSKLGLTHEVQGSRITDKDIEQTLGNYIIKSSSSGITTLGIDIGYPYIHYEVDEWTVPNHFSNSIDMNFQARPKVIAFGKLREFEELDEIMKSFWIRFAIIDAHPERRKAYEFASRFWGKVRLVFYSVGISGKQIHVSENDEATVSVDRTSWLDLSLGRFKANTITLPVDTDFEYKDHIKAPVRHYKKDKWGNPVGEYLNVKADHFAHARNYAEIAFPLAISIATHKPMVNVL